MIVTVKKVFKFDEVATELSDFMENLDNTSTVKKYRVLDDEFEDGAVVVEAQVILGADAWQLFADY